MVMTPPDAPAGTPALELGPRAYAEGSLLVLPPAVVLNAAIESHRNLRLVMRNPATGGVLVVVLRSGHPTMVFSPGDGRSLAELLVAAGRLDGGALHTLIEQRPREALSLQGLVIEHTDIEREEVQQFLDYQARQRLLDALAWRDGTFHIEECAGGEETTFSLGVPSVASLLARAEARAVRLPVLLALLPSTIDNVTVRRRRLPRGTLDRIRALVLAETAERLPLRDLLPRLLVDDDIALEAVLALADRGDVALEPRARLVGAGSDAGHDLHAEGIVREISTLVRGVHAGEPSPSLWFVLIAPSYETAAAIVRALGETSGGSLFGSPESGTVCRALVRPSPGVAVSWLAVHPRALNGGALFGVMGRCDGVVLVRAAAGAPTSEQFDELLRRLLAALPRPGTRPPVLGLDLGARWREWDDRVDAALGLPDGAGTRGAGVAVALLEGMLAAARSWRV
jgi:hypothetical protein